MTRYLIERTVGPITKEELETAARTSKQVLEGMSGVQWVRSYVSDREGKIFCEYDAPDEESIREHARRAGLPVDRITEITVEVSPAMFR